MFHFILIRPPHSAIHLTPTTLYWQKGWTLSSCWSYNKLLMCSWQHKRLSDTRSTRGAHPCEQFFGETLNPLILFCPNLFKFPPRLRLWEHAFHLQLLHPIPLPSQNCWNTHQSTTNEMSNDDVAFHGGVYFIILFTIGQILPAHWILKFKYVPIWQMWRGIIPQLGLVLQLRHW